jgi:peptidoglycan-associated lipoprotein
MKLIFKTALFTMIIIGIGLFSGCQKKVTKVEAPAPTAAKPSAAPEAPKPEALPPLEEFKPIDMDAQIREALQTVYFDFDKYDLRSDAVSRLEIVARYLQEHKTLRVLAEGHCDERGSSEYNMGLGENRARAVKKYLVSYGINQARLEITSYGKERLAKPGCGDDDFCNQANRRVEWKVLVK